MKPLRLRIRAASQRQGIPQQVIEKDYVLSYILAGISSHPGLQNVLVFKGGTALKKLFFGEYRFSEDLDFSCTDSPKDEKLEEALREAVKETHRLMGKKRSSYAYNSLGIPGLSVESNWKSLTMNRSCWSPRNVG